MSVAALTCCCGGNCPQPGTCCDCCAAFTCFFGTVQIRRPSQGNQIKTYSCGSIIIGRNPSGSTGCPCAWGGFGSGSTQCTADGDPPGSGTLFGSIACGPDGWFLTLSTTGNFGADDASVVYVAPHAPCPPENGWTRVSESSLVVSSPPSVSLTCDGEPPPTTGACCHGPEGTQCSDMTEAECQHVNGTWFPGVDCTQVNCTTPIGACCYVDPVFGGQCVNTTAAQCTLLGGTWFAPPVTCATHQCQFGEGGDARVVSRGFGDTASKFIKAVTFGKLKECKSCAERRAWLNRWLPYGTGGQAT